MHSVPNWRSYCRSSRDSARRSPVARSSCGEGPGFRTGFLRGMRRAAHSRVALGFVGEWVGRGGFRVVGSVSKLRCIGRFSIKIIKAILRDWTELLGGRNNCGCLQECFGRLLGTYCSHCSSSSRLNNSKSTLNSVELLMCVFVQLFIIIVIVV